MRPRPGPGLGHLTGLLPDSRDWWRQALAETPIQVPDLRASKRVPSHVLVKRQYQNAVAQAKAMRRKYPRRVADTVWPEAFPDVPAAQFSDLLSPDDAAAAAVAYRLRAERGSKHPTRWTVKRLGQSTPTLARERSAAEVDDAVVAFVLETRLPALRAELLALATRRGGE